MAKQTEQEALEAGRQALGKTDKVRHLADVLPHQEFYPEAEQINWGTLEDKSIIIREAVILPDFETDFGRHDLALIRFDYVEGGDPGKVYTTACSGTAVLNQIRRLQAKKNGFPVQALVNHSNPYWLLV